MSKDLIAALEYWLPPSRPFVHQTDDPACAAHAKRWDEARDALSRHRSSVESVELPEPDGVMIVGTQALRGFTASTVRSLIAAAVEREREQCHLIAEAEQLRREAIRYNKGEDHAWEGGAASAAEQIAAAIRARGEK